MELCRGLANKKEFANYSKFLQNMGRFFVKPGLKRDVACKLTRWKCFKNMTVKMCVDDDLCKSVLLTMKSLNYTIKNQRRKKKKENAEASTMKSLNYMIKNQGRENQEEFMYCIRVRHDVKCRALGIHTVIHPFDDTVSDVIIFFSKSGKVKQDNEYA